ncbi:hypothetical protein [Deinococcus sp. UYEF24]
MTTSPRVRICLFSALAVFVALDAAGAAGIRGQLGNPQDVKRLMGRSDDVYVLFASFTQASVVGRGELKDGGFFLTIPDTQTLRLRPFEVCDGVRTSVPIRVYQTETILLYNNALNRAVGPLIQANTAVNPSKVARWMYSDKPATVVGQCTGLSTSYDLTLKAGWNAVLAVSATDSGKLVYTNLNEQLPYWLSGDFKFDKARITLPAAFFKAQRTLTR